MAAWDGGFRHFDVAPSYGLGLAEIYLARFLDEVGRNEVTITTKAGIARPATGRRVTSVAHSVSRLLLKQVPALRRTLGRTIRQSTARGQFGIPFLQDSLEDSLRFLKTDHIDLFLMHEMTQDDFTDDIVSFLQHARDVGKIGCFGIGSRRERLAPLLPLFSHYVGALQTSWVWESPFPRVDAILQNYYGTLRNLAPFTAFLDSNRHVKDQLSAGLGIDLNDPQGRVDALLSLALADTTNGLIVVQSRRARRITALEVDKRIAPSIIYSTILLRLLEMVRLRAY
jgi:D-threo-aldose 1-dehydrogenase